MSAVAVIGRELRAESRRPGNYWLRVLAAGGLMLVFASLVITWQDDAAYLGRTLFRILYQTTLFACWILTPLMTADCISRERREGTLGLLFLTPLTPLEIVSAYHRDCSYAEGFAEIAYDYLRNRLVDVSCILRLLI